MNNNSLYEQDFVVWAEQMADKLQSRDFESLDIQNLVDEVQSLATRERLELKETLRTLFACLIRWQYMHTYDFSSGPEKRRLYSRWGFTITESRYSIQDQLEISKSLEAYFEKTMDECFTKGRKRVVSDPFFTYEDVPTQCPYTKEQILDDEFFPDFIGIRQS